MRQRPAASRTFREGVDRDEGQAELLDGPKEPEERRLVGTSPRMLVCPSAVF